MSQPIRVGAQNEFYPYSFVDTDGVLKGFAVDLVDAVAREMKLNIQRIPLRNNELATALHSGRVEMLQCWGETKARRASYDFSVPMLRFETAIVVRRSNSPVKTLSDLAGRRVAFSQRGTLGEQYLIEQQPEAVRIFAQTNDQFLRMLAAGEVDAAVMSRLTAVSMIDRLGLNKQLMVLDERVRGYDVRYCVAVHRGEALLLARFNEGLAIVHRTGEYDDIYHKWFGRYARQRFTTEQVLTYVAAALALGCALATWAFFRQRMLSRRITRQTTELSEQRSLLAALHDQHPQATVVLEMLGHGEPTLVSVNREAASLFKIEPSDAGRPLKELSMEAERRDVLLDALARWTKHGQREQWETRLAGARRQLEITTVPLGTRDTGVQRLCVLCSDVTRRRLRDAEMARLRRLRALGELVGGIAHEFNNLLTPIIATTGLLKMDHGDKPEIRRDLDVIEQAARRSAELTRRLLTFGRKTEEGAQPVLLSDAVANCHALLKTMLDRRIEWSEDLPTGLPPVIFRPIDLHQVIFNLVLNARDTLLERLENNDDRTWTPRIKVSLLELPAAAHVARGTPKPGILAAWQRLTVQDNGRGIPADIVDRIFEPFFTTKEVGKGTGLGLSTVWHQVTEIGGDVMVESQLGQGSKFHVFFPRWESDTSNVAEGPAARESNHPLPRARILIVDDEPLVALAASSTLERLGHTVAHLADGEEAWDHLSANPNVYDLLLIDVNMPRMSGVELVRRLRGAAYAGRIVVMSGRVAEEDIAALKSMRVDKVLAKPFTTEQLASEIGRVVAVAH